jgi:hypothetical protein
MKLPIDNRSFYHLAEVSATKVPMATVPETALVKSDSGLNSLQKILLPPIMQSTHSAAYWKALPIVIIFEAEA